MASVADGGPATEGPAAAAAATNTAAPAAAATLPAAGCFAADEEAGLALLARASQLLVPDVEGHVKRVGKMASLSPTPEKRGAGAKDTLGEVRKLWKKQRVAERAGARR